MELRKYIGIVSTYRWHLILIPLLAAIVGLAATYAVSPRFQGVVTVQIIPEQTESSAVSLRTQDGSGVPAIGLQSPTELLAQGFIEMLGSHEVAGLVAAQLRLDTAPEPQGVDAFRAWVNEQISNVWAFVRYGYVHQHAGMDRAIEQVQGALSASLVRGSYYMRVTGTWRDPATAARLANSAADALIEHSRRVASAAAGEQRRFLETQLAQAKLQVEQARTNLLDYGASNTTVAGESVRLAVNALDAARTTQRQDESQLTDAQQRLALVQQQLPDTPAEVSSAQSTTSSTGTRTSPTPRPSPATQTSTTTTTTTTTASPNSVYLALQQRQNELNQEIAAIQARQNGTALTGQNDVALADARRQLDTAQAQLATVPAETQSVQQTQAGSGKDSQAMTARTSAPNPVYVALQDRVNTLKQQVAGLEGRQSDAEAQRQQNAAALEDARRRLDVVTQQLANTPTEMSVTQTTASVAEPASAPPPEPTADLATDAGSTSDASTTTTQRTSAPNAVYVSLQDRQNQLQAEVAGIRARLDQHQQDVTQREDDLRNLVAKDTKLAQLNQELGLASDAYARRSADWYRAVLEEARPVTQLRVIDPANPPAYPAWPVKVLWAGIGAAAGLLTALVLVFVLYNVDMTLRSPVAAEEAFGDLRLLAVVPSRGNGAHRQVAAARGPRTRGAGNGES